MTRTVRALATVTLVTVLSPLPASAAGGSPSPPAETPKTVEEQAIEHYNTGLAMRDKAWKLEARLEDTTSEKKHAKLETKIRKQYEGAREQFQRAVFKNPRYYQAYGSLGYVHRKTGAYQKSLDSYNRALDIEPRYSEAIEYRAEAYLGLDRVDDAKEAYIGLFGMDRARADELLLAMQVWVEQRRADPGDLAADTVSGFADWVAERDELARQTSSLSDPQKRKW